MTGHSVWPINGGIDNIFDLLMNERHVLSTTENEPLICPDEAVLSSVYMIPEWLSYDTRWNLYSRLYSDISFFIKRNMKRIWI